MGKVQTNEEAIAALDTLTNRGIQSWDRSRKPRGTRVVVRKSRAQATKGWYIFWKVVTKDRKPPFAKNWPSVSRKDRNITYSNGATVKADRVNRQRSEDCGSGLHILCSPPRRRDVSGWASPRSATLIRVLVHPDDVACVPDRSTIFSVRKIRVRKLTVDKKVPWK